MHKFTITSLAVVVMLWEALVVSQYLPARLAGDTTLAALLVSISCYRISVRSGAIVWWRCCSELHQFTQ